MEEQGLVKLEATMPQLPEEMWRLIFSFISDNDLINLSTVSKHFQRLVRTCKSQFDLNCCHRLNTNFLLNFALSEKCTGLNIDNCRWLEAGTILEIISRTKLQHLSIVRCQISEECVRTVCDLPLESLSFLYDWKWQSYFLQRSPETSIPCFKNLKNLRVLYSSVDCCTLEFEDLRVVYDIVKCILVHCKELENFQLREYLHYIDGDREKKYLGFRDTPNFSLPEPFLPKLRSLVVDIGRTYHDLETITNFTKLILKDRVIPLEHVDLGIFTFELFLNGILLPHLIQEKENFSLRCREIGNYWNLEEFEGLDALIKRQGAVKKLCFQNISLNRFADLISKVLVHSQESIREVFIKNYWMDHKSALQGIQLLTINCPQITALDLQMSNWMEISIWEDEHICCSAIEKNLILLETISHFKNLQRLRIGAPFLACFYYEPDPLRKFHMAMPFGKIIESCEQLEEISIEGWHDSNNVHMDSIYEIAQCKKLKVLKISNVTIRGSSDFDLSKLTKSCSQLKKLVISEIHLCSIDDSHEHPLIVEENMKFAKNLQSLKLQLDGQGFNKTFIDSLNECPNLESINFNLLSYNHVNLQYFADLLPILKNLFRFKLYGNKKSRSLLSPVCRSIKENKPTFCYKLSLGHDFFESDSDVDQADLDDSSEHEN